VYSLPFFFDPRNRALAHCWLHPPGTNSQIKFFGTLVCINDTDLIFVRDAGSSMQMDDLVYDGLGLSGSGFH
jgi:hypothetical protein